ncbi:hybrid sensor histidine kinase/response regulator [soil metagenome]
MSDSFSLEPNTPDLLESYLYDAWDVLSQFSDAVAVAGEGAPETQATLSLLSHRLRGTSAQYGFTQTAKLAELVETLLEHAHKLPLERRGDLQVFLEQVMACLGSSLERVAATGKEGGVGLEFAAIGGSRLLKALLKNSPESFVRQSAAKVKVSVSTTASAAADTTATLRKFYREHAEDWEFFAPEAAEHVEAMAQATDEAAARLAKNEACDEQVGALFRATHTLKGAAYMVGLNVMGDLIHTLEDLMVQVRDGVRAFDPAALHLLETGHHTLSLMLETAPGKATSLEAVLAEHKRDTARFFGLPEPETAANAELAAGLHPATPDPEAGVAPLRAELQQFYATQQDVWSYFEPEVYEHLATVQGFLDGSSADPDDDMLAELYRAMHTLKGASYMVGLTPLGDLSARLEHLLTDVREQDRPFADVRETLSQGAHLIDLMVQAARGEGVALGAAYRDFGLEPQTETPLDAAAADQPQVGVALKVTTQGSVRVRLDKLERLMTLAGDTVTLRSRLERQTTQLAQVSELLRTSRARMLRTVTEFEANYLNPQLDAQKNEAAATTATKNTPQDASKQGLRASLDELFDDLEFDTYNDLNILARSVAEMADDLGEVETQLGTLTRGYQEETDLLQKLSRELRSEVGRARMVPVGQLFSRLRRLLKNSGSRSYQLGLSGENVEIDTLVLEGLTDPLLHLVRNALVHGVEPSEHRAALGKTPEGNVSLRAYPLGNNVYIEVEDDGAGIDVAAVKRKAVESGLKTQREVEVLSDLEAAQLIFLPGLSTARDISTEAGRGVGMDAVLDSVTALKGEVSIRTEPGVGTRFTLKLPLTLIVSEVLTVRAADQVVAFPANAVEVLRFLPTTAFEQVDGKAFVTTNDERLPFYDLVSLLGLSDAASGAALGATSPERPVAVLKAGGERIAVGVDELLELEEVVVRGVSDLLKGVSYLSGTSVSSAGTVVLLLDPDGLRTLAGEEVRRETVSRPVRAAQSAGRRVLLVDDSVSVRRVLGKMLSRADYTVTTAVDGQEAVELILQGQRFDAILTDLEMPRLNGYELIEEVRRRPDLAELPIIVMTTRAGEKHRKLAFDLGATDYFSKPADETKLLTALATSVRRVNAKPSGVN